MKNKMKAAIAGMALIGTLSVASPAVAAGGHVHPGYRDTNWPCAGC